MQLSASDTLPVDFKVKQSQDSGQKVIQSHHLVIHLLFCVSPSGVRGIRQLI